MDYGGGRICVCEARPLVWALLGEFSVSWLGEFEGQGRRPHELPWGNRTPELQAFLSELEKTVWGLAVGLLGPLEELQIQ